MRNVGEVGREDIECLRSKFITLDFWNLAPVEKNENIYLDGSDWLLEGIRHGKYHAVSQWSPQESPFRDTALYMLRLTEMEIENEEIY